MSTETFSAVAQCPRCEKVAIHSLRLPRRIPDDPLEAELMGMWEKLAIAMDMWGGPRRLRLWEEQNAECVRQCECGHEWINV